MVLPSWEKLNETELCSNKLFFKPGFRYSDIFFQITPGGNLSITWEPLVYLNNPA